MLVVKTPQTYINEPGVLREAGKHISVIGKKPLIIGGPTALEAVGKEFFDSLKAYEIDDSHIHVFKGFPSDRQFNIYAEKSVNINADVIIAIGGGRVIDTAKAVGDITNLPVVAVPTIAATCASWAAITIQYDDEGAFVQTRSNKQSARLVLADPEVIFKAPTRYLFSGVVDTFAKFYETRPTLSHYPDNTTLRIGVHNSELAFSLLEESTFVAIEEAKKGIYGKAARDVIDSIIYLAGVVGSFQENLGYYSFAHPFYHCSTRLANTRFRLHGEKVAYGILAQLVLEKKSEEEIGQVIALFEKYQAAFQLKDLGIDENVEADLKYLGENIPKTFQYVKHTADEIQQALLTADRLVKEKIK